MEHRVKGGLIVLVAIAAFVGVSLVIRLSGRDEGQKRDPGAGERMAEPSVPDEGKPSVDAGAKQVDDAAPLAYVDDPGAYPVPVGPGDTLEPPQAWGEAVDGVQVRLRADKTVWQEGKVPHFAVDVRNQGDRHMTIAPTQEQCEIEMDGRWYTWHGFVRLFPQALGPGDEHRGIVVSMHDYWRPQGVKAALTLTPGRHTVRVACQPEYQEPGRSVPVRAVSRPVEIEILPADPATPLPPSGVRLFVMEDEAWGTSVQGLRCRLRTEKPTWHAGEIPLLRADVRNESNSQYDLTPVQELCEIEFDGTWYDWGEAIRLGLRVPPFSPGRQFDGIRIELDKRWHSAEGKAPLRLQPGKHTVRVAFIARPTDGGERVRAISNAVEITIKPALPGSGGS